MHSEGGSENSNDITWQALTGTRSTSYQGKNIYLRKTPPESAEDLAFYKDSYIVITNATLDMYYVDAQNKLLPVNLSIGNTDSFKSAMSKEIQRIRQLDVRQDDFYILPPSANMSTDNIMSKIAGMKNPGSRESESAFVFHNDKIYFVNKAKNTISALDKLTTQEVEIIKQKLGVPREIDPSDPVQLKKLVSFEKDILTHLIDQRKMKISNPVDSKTPIAEFFPEQSMNAVQSFINSQEGHTNGQYCLYTAEINPAQYPPNRGDLISEELRTPEELKKEPLLDYIHRTIKATIALPFWRETQVEIILKGLEDKATNPETYAQLLEKLMEALQPSSGYDPDFIQKKALANITALHKRVHDELVVEPRLDRAYPIAGAISLLELNREELEETFRNHENSTALAKSWIVSDVDPAVVKKEHGIGSEKGHSFVCFSEYDALALADKIKENRAECQRYLEAKPINILEVSRLSDIDARKKVMEELSKVVINNVALETLVNKQQEYVAQYDTLKNDILFSPIKVELGKKPFISQEEYIHFKQTADIYEACDNVFNSMLRIEGNINFSKLNTSLTRLYELCKNYIDQHPYKNKENDPVFNLIHRLEEVKKIIPQLSLSLESAKQLSKNKSAEEAPLQDTPTKNRPGGR